MMQADEEPQPITRFCSLDQRGSATVQLWKNTDRRSSLITQSPSLSLLPRHCCLLREPIQRSAFTSLDSFVINVSRKVTGTRHNLNTRDIFRLIRKDLNFVTTDECKSFIIFGDAAIPPHLFSNICYSKGSRILIGNTGCHINDNDVSSDLKNLTFHSPCEPSNDDSQDSQTEMVIGDYFHMGKLKSLLKSCQNCNNPGVSSERNRNVKTSKSVSFDDDVTVYMFDQVLMTWVSALAWWVLSFVSTALLIILLIQTKGMSTCNPRFDILFRTGPPRSCTLSPAHLSQAAIPVTCQMSHQKTVVLY